jgi:hypothetical protein
MRDFNSEFKNLVDSMNAQVNDTSSSIANWLNLPNASICLVAKHGKGKIRTLRAAAKSRRITNLVLPSFQKFRHVRGTLAFVLNGVKTRERHGRVRECTLVLVFGLTRGIIPEATIAMFKKWHGSIGDQFDNINRATDILLGNRQKWPVPQEIVDYITKARVDLDGLIKECRTTAASADLRMKRNTLLKNTVGFFLLTVRNWTYGQFSDGTMTIDDIHSLGFLLSGERSGQHRRASETLALAQVKVRVNDDKTIVAVVDKSYAENAALVTSGWPTDARMAVIVIKDTAGNEVYRQMTTRLHNEIIMPGDSRGKQFMIKASFLKHVDDETHFGNEPTFSMPLTTEDLAAIHDQQHHDDFEERLRAIEQHRREVEELEADHAAAKANRDASSTGK